MGDELPIDLVQRLARQCPTVSAEVKPRLSIILVNHNGLRYLADCLDSIRLQVNPQPQVILEDNASTDGSADLVTSEYPWVQVIKSSENRGFAGGNNLAALCAVGEYILLLNTDTVLQEPVGAAVDWLERNPDYGALTICMVDGNQRPVACTGRFPSLPRLALLRLMLKMPSEFGQETAYDVEWVQGSFLLVRSSVWKDLNGLDERFFMYAEDVEFCKRIWDKGYKCAYMPGLRYLHWGGFNPSRFYAQMSGLYIYVNLHMKGIRRVSCKIILLSGCMLRAVVFGIKAVLFRRDSDQVKASASWTAFQQLWERVTKGSYA